jgi:hypothetical protein
MKFSFGLYVYGLAAIASGFCAFAWHDFSALGNVPHRAIFISIAATIEVLGGVAIQLASQLTTTMILGFELLVWLPMLFADPHHFVNWTEGMETLGIAG